MIRILFIAVTILAAMLAITCAPPALDGNTAEAPPTSPSLPPPTPSVPPPSAQSEQPAETPQTELKLTIIEPADNSIVSNSVVAVEGKTSPGAVVSINGEMTTANSLGNFTVTIVLEEGPNVIEVIASDEYGNEATATLTVILMKGE